MPSVSISPINESYEHKCPTCGATVLRVTPDSQEVKAGKTWLGDSFGIRSGLEGNETAFTIETSVYDGTCAFCGSLYYVLAVDLVPGCHMLDRRQAFWDYLSLGFSEHSIGQYDDTTWQVTEVFTRYGLMQRHTIGPFVVAHPLQTVTVDDHRENEERLLDALLEPLLECCKARAVARAVEAEDIRWRELRGKILEIDKQSRMLKVRSPDYAEVLSLKISQAMAFHLRDFDGWEMEFEVETTKHAITLEGASVTASLGGNPPEDWPRASDGKNVTWEDLSA